ncbi:class I SAM-dependent methyltransferase [Gryllotalpicola ginsengisoli]|uniref:class I SAM-dependent methyltransferase n=1 Tax=Gryllotalpicola ginsengisoli TaxID=444608 RepID=UPI0003B6C845|nr:methyltransferase [Gryllotalpicola ginsengisoli]
MSAPAIDLARLRRRPDVEAPNLVAVDAADRLLLDEAAPLLAGTGPGAAPGAVVVLGDNFGALTLGALAAGAQRVRVHQDALVGELALAANAADVGVAGGYVSLDLGAELLTDASLVLARLPKSLDQLDEWAELIAAHAAPGVTVLAGGMVKHMTRAQNDVLARHFADVTASLARQKARVLRASGVSIRAARESTGGPSPSAGRLGGTAGSAGRLGGTAGSAGRLGGTAGSAGRLGGAAAEWRPRSWPKTARLDPPGITVSAHGGVFAGACLDIGTRFLLEHLDDAKPDARTAIDLGCGTGVLAAAIALARPGLRVLATDQSAAAVASARETMALNSLGDRVTVVRDDRLSAQPDDSAELILLNPPFHTGTTVTADVGIRLIADAARVLAPGGELRVVFNSHLRYQPTLRRLVGPTRQVARNAKFTITASVKR